MPGAIEPAPASVSRCPAHGRSHSLQAALALHQGRRTKRPLWKIGGIRAHADAPPVGRQTQLRIVEEHVRHRMDYVRNLVEVRTSIVKEKRHVGLMRGALRRRLERGEITETDYENEMADAKETLTDYQRELKALKKSGV